MGKKLRILSLGLMLILGLTVNAPAAVDVSFKLGSHSGGNQAPPFYGFRFDNLDNASDPAKKSDGRTVWTFDFDHASSNMKMEYDNTANTIHIFGQTYGGLDVGTTYDAVKQGLFKIDFLYKDNVSGSGLTRSVNKSANNTGFIEYLGNAFTLRGGGKTVWFTDEAMGTPSFHVDSGHRGEPGLSGWGWVTPTDTNKHTASQDWLFTAYPVPEPGSLLVWTILGSVAALGLYRRKRTSKRI